MKVNLIVQAIETLESVVQEQAINKPEDLIMVRKISSCIFLLKSALERIDIEEEKQ